MTSSIMHRMAGLARAQEPVIAAPDFVSFAAEYSSTATLTQGTVTALIPNSETFDSESVYDVGTGEFVVPASMNGHYAYLSGGILIDVEDDIEVRMELSTDGGSVWNSVATNEKESVGASVSKLVLLNTGHRYRLAAGLAAGVNRTIQASSASYISGIILANV